MILDNLWKGCLSLKGPETHRLRITDLAGKFLIYKLGTLCFPPQLLPQYLRFSFVVDFKKALWMTRHSLGNGNYNG